MMNEYRNSFPRCTFIIHILTDIITASLIIFIFTLKPNVSNIFVNGENLYVLVPSNISHI